VNEDPLLEQYSRLPESLEAALAGLDEASLDLRLDEGWSIRQYVHHVVDGEALWQMNLKVILGNNGVFFPFTWYFTHTQDEWADIWAYDRRPLGPTLAAFRASAWNLSELIRCMPDKWDHYGCVTWPGTNEEARFTVRQIVEMHIRHVTGHTVDIRSIRLRHHK
jgi:hypothetical protein